MWVGLDNLVDPIIGSADVKGNCIRMIYTAHNRIIASPRNPDSSGIFKHDGFLRRYERYCDNLDSSFCSVKNPITTTQPTATQKP